MATAPIEAMDCSSKIGKKLVPPLVDFQSPPDGCIWLFNGECLTEEKLEVCSNVADLKIKNFENITSSIKIGKGVKNVYLYSGRNYADQSMKINQTTYTLYSTQFNNRIASLKIEK